MNAARVAIVTGGGRGLGRAVALRLAADGVDVGLVARSAAEIEAVATEVRALGARAVAVTADVTSGEQVDAAVAEVADALGRIDILVNNAGSLLYKPFVPLPTGDRSFPGFDTGIDDDDWAQILDVHVGGAIRFLRAVGPGMLEREHGRVVNVVSNVVRRTVPFTVGYDTAKGALVQLTRSLAREWARYGVTVNAVAAGHFKTEMSRVQFENEASYAAMMRRVPMRRPGAVDEFADAVAYFAGAQAGFVTGEVLAVDGGETL